MVRTNIGACQKSIPQPRLTRRGFLGGTAMAASALLAGCGGSGVSAADTSGTAAGSAVAAGGYTLVTEGTLTCVSDMANPPFSSYVEGTTDPEGYEVDLMAAVGEQMGLAVEWLPQMNFDLIIPAIKEGGKADLGVSNFTITDARKQEIDFTDPYYEANLGLVVQQGTDLTTSEALDAAGATVAVQSGTTGEDWVKENMTGVTIVSLKDPIESMNGVLSGLYDATVADLPVVEDLVAKSYITLEVVEQIPTGDEYGIVVSKDSPALTVAVNEALATLRDEGTIDELLAKWGI